MKTIDLLITTWLFPPIRFVFLWRTLRALDANLRHTGYELSTIVSAENESTSAVCRQTLTEFCNDRGARLIWHKGEPNLGSHLNFAFGECPSDLRFYVQDDWLLKVPIDIGPGADLLESDADIAMVRYYASHCRFADMDDQWSTTVYGTPSPYGDNPLLAHRRWLDKVGEFKIGNTPGHHEVKMGTQLKNSGLKVAVPRELAEFAKTQFKTKGNLYFEHIGDTSAFRTKRGGE